MILQRGMESVIASLPDRVWMKKAEMPRGRVWKHISMTGPLNCRSLHCATPDFLWNLVALMHFMRPSLRKGAHAAMSCAAWQEIRVRSGRDDKG
jgi:hypothetical protein